MVSIIIPIYNTEKYLTECIESILCQTYTDWELLLIDDGSTDSSGKIADKYATRDNRIKAFHIENGGQARARNVGIDNANGDFIMFVDSDDELFPFSVEVLLNSAKAIDADIVQGKYKKYRYHTEKKVNTFNHIRIFDNVQAAESLLYQKLLNSSPWGKIFKKGVFDDLRFVDGLYYEDIDLNFNAFLRSNKICYINQSVYFYRPVSTSFINTWNKKRLDVLKVTKAIDDYVTQNFPSLIGAAHDRGLSANFNIFALASMHNEYDIAQDCWQIIKKYRHESLFNPKVRLKNKLGIILSYFGSRFFSFISRFVYK